MKDLAKGFFSSKASKIGMWVFLWIFEYILFSWCVNKLPEDIIMIVIFIGYVLLVYAVYYWVTQKRSTECQIYALIILEFVFYKLNQESVFIDLFDLPFWTIYIILSVYFIIRIFILEKIYHLLHDIYSGFVESRRDRVQLRIIEMTKEQEILTKKKIEKAEYIKNRSLIRRQFWSDLRDKVIDFLLNIIGFLIAIPLGLFGKNKNTNRHIKKIKNKEITLQDASKRDNAIHTPWWVKFVIALIVFFTGSVFFLLVYYQFYVFKNDSSMPTETNILTIFVSNLHDNKYSFDWITNLIGLGIINAILFIIIVIISFIIFVIIIQIIKSGHRMIEDLMKSINNPNETDYSSIVFYSAIVFAICFFAYKLYPFELDSFVELLSNGAIIIYPIMAAVFIPIITTVIDVLNGESIKKFKDDERVQNVKEKIIDLSVGTLEAILNYITFVSKDFLRTIQELSIDEFRDDINDTKGGNANGNNIKNGNVTSNITSDDCDNNSDKINK